MDEEEEDDIDDMYVNDSFDNNDETITALMAPRRLLFFLFGS